MIRRLLSQDLPAHITIANLLAYGLTFVTTVAIARGLGSVGRGETSAALSAFSFAPALVGIGIPLELRRRSAVRPDDASVRSARDVMMLLVPISLAGGVAFSNSVFPDAPAALRLAALVGVGAAPLSVSWASDTGVLMGQGRYRAVFGIRLAQPLLQFVVVVVSFAFGGLTAATVLFGSVLGSMGAMVLSAGFVAVGLKGGRSSHLRLVRDGVEFAGSAIADSASARLDQILVLPLIGAAAAGQYTVAASISLLPVVLGQALAAEHFRAVAALSGMKEAQEARCHQAVREAMSVTLPVCLLSATASVPLLPFVFGDEFRHAVALVWILLPGSICVTVGYVCSMLLAAQGRGGLMTLLQVVGLAADVGFLFALGPAYSSVGAAVASSVGYVVLFAGQIVVLHVPLRCLSPSLKDFVGGIRSLLRSRV